MALAHELNPEETTGKLSVESTGAPFGEVIRDYEPLPDTKWRFGKPNYARVNAAYFKNRTMKHAEGSLESIVSKLVKNWEVESHHVSDIKQWQTMDIDKFTIQLNGGPKVDSQLMADEGPYNLLVGDTPEYAASKLTFEESNKIWSKTFPDGFAWEVLEVLSGPPNVTFKWRHFGECNGEYVDSEGVTHKGDGEIVNVIGLCIAKVSDKLIIESLDVYYNPQDLLSPLVAKVTAAKQKQRETPQADSCKNCTLM